MKKLAVFIGAGIFGFGLALSGMVKQEVVLSFLQLKDLGLLFVMGGGIAVTMLTYQLVPRLRKKPLLGGFFDTYAQKTNKNTIIGAVIFGIGWGVSGLCPGSAFASVGVGNYPVLIGITAMFIGSYIQGVVER